MDSQTGGKLKSAKWVENIQGQTMHTTQKIFIMFATISHVRCALKNPTTLKRSMGSVSAPKTGFQLVLLRHGESTWNDENKFTGWYDCPLSEKGKAEALAAGQLLNKNDFKFDLAYTSYLQRAIKTLWFSLEETGHMYIPIKNAWQLNERY